MSLKAFHLVFITASTLLAFGVTAWGLDSYFGGGSVRELIFGLASAACGVGLIIYGKYFLKKLKHISYL